MKTRKLLQQFCLGNALDCIWLIIWPEISLRTCCSLHFVCMGWTLIISRIISFLGIFWKFCGIPHRGARNIGKGTSRCQSFSEKALCCPRAPPWLRHSWYHTLYTDQPVGAWKWCHFSAPIVTLCTWGTYLLANLGN